MITGEELVSHHPYLLGRRVGRCVCVTPVFMSTQDELPLLDLFCGIVFDICPINVPESLQYCGRVCGELISGISNSKVDRLEDKNTGDRSWIWSAPMIRSMTLPFLSN